METRELIRRAEQALLTGQPNLATLYMGRARELNFADRRASLYAQLSISHLLDVQRVAREHNVSLNSAEYVVSARERFEQKRAERLAVAA